MDICQSFLTNLTNITAFKDPSSAIQLVRDDWQILCEMPTDEIPLDIVTRLISQKPYIDRKDSERFVKAIHDENWALMKMFLVMGFDPNTMYGDEFMLEHVFSSFSLWDYSKEILCIFGADVNIVDGHRRSLLQRTIQSGHVSEVIWLIHKGADMYHRDENGLDALRTCLKYRQWHMIDVLAKAGIVDREFYSYIEKRGYLRSIRLIEVFEKLTAEEKERLGVPLDYGATVVLELR